MNQSREFEGANENQAVEKALTELKIDKESLDYEVLGIKKRGIFSKRETVKIRVFLDQNTGTKDLIGDDFEQKILVFLEKLFEKMNIYARVEVTDKIDDKICLNIESPDSGILIGRNGTTLDAIQLLANAISGHLLEKRKKIIIDIKNYRNRRNQKLVNQAQKIAYQVKRSRVSRLLDPMNPFERRLVHTALSDLNEIGTISEGDGLYKQIRIFFKDRESK